MRSSGYGGELSAADMADTAEVRNGTGGDVRSVGYLSAPQREFFLARTRFVGYGGARGGGKSWAVRKKALLLAVHYAGIKILILRRSYPELKENHILPLRAELLGIAEYRESDKCFRFPNGSRIKFGYCDAEGDVLQYQGQEFDIIMIDEATQFSESQFTALTACLRGANALPKRFYITCNPGGVGHGWVKRLFVDRDYRAGESAGDYTFIRARVFDNKPLMDSDPGYVALLRALPPELRRAWLDGDWDVYAGQYFSEFSRERHVIRPHELTGSYRRVVTLDYGLDMLACYWVAVDAFGSAVVYRELYRPGLILSDAAQQILAHTPPGEQIEQYLAPPDLWNRRQEHGRSAADIFAEHGVPLSRAPNARVQGWYNLKEWLRPRVLEDGSTRPRLQIFESCANLIRTLPALRFDDTVRGDAAREPHEVTHAPDALRYFCACHPVAAEPPAPPDDDGQMGYEAQVEGLVGYWIK